MLQCSIGACRRCLVVASDLSQPRLAIRVTASISDLRRLCAGEATCARKRLASDDPRAAAMRRLRSMFSAAMRRNRPFVHIHVEAGHRDPFLRKSLAHPRGRPLTAHERCWHGFCEEWAGPGSRAACANADPGRDRRITSGPHSRTSAFAVTNLRADAYNRCILQFKQIPWPQKNAAANRADTTGG